MARNKLRDTTVRAATNPGKISDGDGLYLNVSKSGSKSWVFIWIRNGRRREMGLGAFGSGTGEVSLAGARVKADAVRAILGRHGDPFTELAERKAALSRPTFGAVADAFVEEMESAWRNPKHRDQWRMTLGNAYCARLRTVFVGEVTTDDVVNVLRPIWSDKHETASRIRGRIEKVLDHAKAKNLRSGENPARWRGHLSLILPQVSKLQRGHHAAMAHEDVPAFVKRLRAAEGVGARALEFTILCAARTGETIGTTWSEIDLVNAVWTVPAVRMKGGREHRVPLSKPTQSVLQTLADKRMGDFVFPGRNPKQPISNATMAKVMRDLGVGEWTVHGFRSSFRDWCGDATDFQREVAEAALAHAIGDETEAAYRRSDALEKRRALMIAWSAHCCGGIG